MRLRTIPAAHLSLLSLVSLCGCGLLPNSTTVQTAAPATVMQIGGSVHGGNQPVTGSTVQLWQVGTTGYGQGATTLGSSVITGAGGSFSLAGVYTCPSSNTLVYITATGGNPGLTAGTNNSALVMMSAIGNCSNLTPSTFLNINEVTTVAAVYALQQFMSPSGNIGSYGSVTNGLFSGFTTFNNLVVSSAGAARTSGIIGSTATVFPTATINTIANILTPCVNSTGPTSASCAALFSAATPAGASVPVSTLSAALSIAQNPGLNQTALFNLSSANPAFQPTLSTKPNDWTLSLGYAQGGNPNALALDAFGNVWTVVYGSGGNSSSITEMSNLGIPATNSPYNNSFFNGAWGLAIDSTGNVWVSNHDNNTAMELDLTGGGVIQGINGLFSGIGLSSPEGIAIDGNGDIWFANNGNNSVTELVPGSGTFSPTQWTGGGLSAPVGVASDQNGDTWVTNSSGGSITSIPQYGGAGASFGPHTGGGLSTPAGIAADAYGNMWVTDSSLSEIAEIGSNGTAISTSSGYTVGGVTNSYSTAIDGTGSIWIADFSGNRLTQLSAVGTALNPSTGYQGGLGSPKALAIDASGNIWVGNAAPVAGATITEFIGTALPAYMPLQAAIQSTSIGLRPGSLQIVSRGLNSATMGTPYTYTFQAIGGSGSYTWSITTGLSSLTSAGFTFSTAGVLSGTPTSTGNISFDVTVKDTVSGQTLQVPYTLQVNAPVQTVCSHDGSGNSFLHGDYAFLMNGFNPAGHFYDVIGAFTANGAGTISGGLGDANGDQNITNFASGAVSYTFSGTYSMGSTDDRGIMTVTNTNSGTPGTGLPTTTSYCFAADTVTAVAGLGTVAESGRIIETDASGYVLTGFFTIQNPTNFNNASLTSGYAFGMQGVDGTTPNRRGLIGQFNADGAGNISSGQMDFSAVNFTSGSYVNTYTAAAAITSSGSSYAVASNGRGTITLNLNGTSLPFIFYMVGTGNQLYLMSANAGASGTTPLLVGHAVQQITTGFTTSSVKATGVFRSAGTTNPNTPPIADNVEVGQISLDGSGNISYVYDQNSGGTITTPTTNNGTATYAVSSIGYLTTVGVPITHACYLWAPGAGFGLDGSLSVDVLFMLPQTVPSGGFSTSNLGTYLNGNYAAGTMFPAAYSTANSNNLYPSVFDLMANFTSGTISLVQDQVTAPGTTGYIQVDVPGTNSYALDPTYGPNSGRFTITNGTKTEVVGYIVSPTQVFLMQSQPGQDGLVIQGDHW